MIRSYANAYHGRAISLFQRRNGLDSDRRLWLFALPLLLLFLTLLRPNSAAAQEGEEQPPIQQMRLQILPEYDDPRVLVIAQGRLDVAGGEYEGPVTFRLPAGAQINQMAVLDLELGGPQSLPFETEADPGDPAWMLVTYTITNPHFFYEYYYDLPGSGSQKQFSFVLNNLQPITTLSVEVQQPLKAEAFALEPAALNSRSDTAGFTYWQYPDRTVGGGEGFEVLIRYTKTDPEPSIIRQDQTAVQSKNAGSSAAPTPTGELPSSWVALTLVGVGLVVAVGFWRHRFRPRETEMVAAVTRPVPIQKSRPVSVVQSGDRRFCTNCGEALPGTARFCPYCGTEIRR